MQETQYFKKNYKKQKKKTNKVTDSCMHKKTIFPLINCVYDSDLGTFHSLHHEGQILKFQKDSLYPRCVLIAQVAKVSPPFLLCEKTDMKKLVLSVPFTGNWIMSENAFYTVIND